MPDSPKSKPESGFVCACQDWMRSACAADVIYSDPGKRYCVLHFPGKEKSADFKAALQRKLDNKDFDFRGVWFPDEVSFEGFDFSSEANFHFATFSADVNFSSTTFSAEANFSSATFSAWADFSSATFSARAYFSSATFSLAPPDFSSATFSAEADFSYATFSGEADFRNATFSATAEFRSATFSVKAYFFSATFDAAAIFSRATFALANFVYAIFRAETYFNEAIFKDYVEFAGREGRQPFSKSSSLDLQFATIEQPDRVSYHTLTLHPHWFINVDPRKFGFTNTDWGRPGINAEITSLKTKKISSPHRLLAIACRHLAVNAEENHRYEEASEFRYMSMDARRLKWKLRGKFFNSHWKTIKKTLNRLARSMSRDGKVLGRTRTRLKRFVIVYCTGFDFLHWVYWVASGYGERIMRAFTVLIVFWLLFAGVYTRVGFARSEPKSASESDVAIAKRFDVSESLPFKRALAYSLGVMMLQRPEPKPATTAAQTLVLFETILGPVQAALLALAIRRKFMR
jgi:uncharacterized protein YjbI with pentapeptide repeats